MSCFSEFHYSLYLDGELPPSEVRTVEDHLAGCEPCRTLVEALRSENILLTSALVGLVQDKQAPAFQPAPATAQLRDVLWTGLAVLAAAAGLQVGWNLLSGFEAQTGAGWLNPFGVAAQWTLFFDTIFYLVQEGAAVILSNLTTISLLVLTLMVAGAGFVLLRRRPSTAVVLAGLALVVLVSQPVSALDHRNQKGSQIRVPAGETLDDTLLARGESVQIDGTVTGNVIAFAKQLTVKGVVQGDVVCFCALMDIDGAVDGNIYTFAESLNVRGHVGRSLFTFAKHLKLAESSQIAEDILAFVAESDLDGTVARDVMIFSERVAVRGNIGRNLIARVEKCSLFAPAHISGDLRARVAKEKNFYIDPGATVAGKTDITTAPARQNRYFQARFYLRRALGLGVIFVLGLLLLWLFPVFRSTRLPGGAGLAKAVGVGFLAFVSPPVAALLLFIVLIGIGILTSTLLIATLIPLLLTVLWLLTLYLSKVLVGLGVGAAMLRTPADQPTGYAKPLLIGLAVVYILISLPLLGHVMNFAVWLLGLGLGILHVWRRRASAVTA